MPAQKVAVIGGTGDEGFGLATRWAMAGIEIVIGSRDEGRAREAAERLEGVVPGARVTGMENAAAASSSELVMVTVPRPSRAAIALSIRLVQTWLSSEP